MVRCYNLIHALCLVVTTIFVLSARLNAFCDIRTSSTEYPFAATVERTTGRLGDQLIMYTKQKWFCWKYGGQLLHVPFPQSSLFALDGEEEHYNARHHTEIYKKHDPAIDSVPRIGPDLLHPPLYTLGFVFHDNVMAYDCFNNAEFRGIVRSALKPTIFVNEIELSEDVVTVALHVRKGGDYDGKLLSNQFFVSPPYAVAPEYYFQKFPCPIGKPSSYIDENWPLRFLPDQFYIDQLSILASTMSNATLHVYLFTDASDPDQLVEAYKQQLKNHSNLIITTVSAGEHERIEQHTSGDMVIDYRNDDEYNAQLLAELFCMSRCDILIRGSSGVSLMAEIIGHHSLVVTPAHYHWSEKTLIMDTVIIRGANNELVEDYGENLLGYNAHLSEKFLWRVKNRWGKSNKTLFQGND